MGNAALTSDRGLTLFKTRDDSRGRTPWQGPPRPPETRVLTVRFEALSKGSHRAEEADEHGWRDPTDTSRALSVTAQDVAFIRRPLAPGDVAIAAAAAAALRAWLATHGGPFEQIAAGAAASAGPDVTLIFDGLEIDPLASKELARARWFDTNLPVTARSTAAPSEVAKVRARLVDAASPQRPAVTRALAAEGDETAAALLAWLDDDSLWNPGDAEPWMVPWALSALALRRDASVLPAMLRALSDHFDALDDFRFEGLVSIFSAVGPAAIGTLTAVLRAEPLDRYLRLAAGEALYGIGVEHPAERGRIAETFAALYAGLRGGVGDDAFLASALYAEAARVRDSQVDDAVRAAHALGIWEEDFVEFEAWVAEQREAAWSLGGSIRGETLDALLAKPWWER